MSFVTGVHCGHIVMVMVSSDTQIVGTVHASIQFRVTVGAGAYPGCHRARGRVRTGRVAHPECQRKPEWPQRTQKLHTDGGFKPLAVRQVSSNALVGFGI